MCSVLGMPLAISVSLWTHWEFHHLESVSTESFEVPPCERQLRIFGCRFLIVWMIRKRQPTILNWHSDGGTSNDSVLADSILLIRRHRRLTRCQSSIVISWVFVVWLLSCHFSSYIRQPIFYILPIAFLWFIIFLDNRFFIFCRLPCCDLLYFWIFSPYPHCQAIRKRPENCCVFDFFCRFLAVFLSLDDKETMIIMSFFCFLALAEKWEKIQRSPFPYRLNDKETARKCKKNQRLSYPVFSCVCVLGVLVCALIFTFHCIFCKNIFSPFPYRLNDKETARKCPKKIVCVLVCV